MKVEKFHSGRIVLLRMILLIVPAMVAGAYVLWYVNEYYSVLTNKWLFESISLAVGLICGCLVFNFNYRFLPVFIVLLLLFFTSGSIIRNTFTGEFNAFYAATNFYIYSFLFIAGFICGWGFVRHRYFPIALSVVLLVVQTVVVIKSSDVKARRLIVVAL